jgi:hypothetical protein
VLDGAVLVISAVEGVQPQTLADPRNREEYMLQLAGRATAAAPGQAESSGGR